jgi:hypothetical protein
MTNFKDYFYLKEEVITDIHHIFETNIAQDIDISNQQLTKLPNWMHLIVKGDFDCYSNNLTSLEGAPKEVGGNFYCCNNNLTSLEGAPKEVGRNFSCLDNNLISLEGAPKEVGRHFNCSNNLNLTILESGSKIVSKDFYCFNCPNIREDQWQYLPIINGSLITNKVLNRNELLTLQRLKALGRIGELDLRGNIEQSEDEDDPFNL